MKWLLQKRADQAFAKKNYTKALSLYREILANTKPTVLLYDRLIACLHHSKHEWSEADFSDSVDWTMQKQALENPEIAKVHERLSPEWQEIQKKISEMMTTPDEERTKALVLEIESRGIQAINPLITTLLEFKKKMRP